ncbi:MAG: M56 family metallopeptidase [Bacteroidota bacterium]
MNGLAYLIQVNLYLILFYGLYVLLLRGETFFKLNRIYLVGSALLSLAIPLMKAKWVTQLFLTDEVKEFSQTFNTIVTEANFTSDNLANNQINISVEQPMFTLANGLTIIYITVTLLLLINLLRKFYLIKQLVKGDTTGKAFSFFKEIIIDQNIDGKEAIMEHELVHVKQWHSADIIFFEIFAIVNWFNPIAFAYKKSVRKIHEFIADETAANFLSDKSAYALLLVSNSFNTQPEYLANNFFNQTFLKRRLIMLNNKKSKKVAILKYGLAVPLFAAMVIFTSATGADAQAISQIEKAIYPLIDKLEKDPLTQTEKQLAPKVESAVIKAKMKPAETAIEENPPVATPKNLLDYVNNIYGKVSMTKIAKEGNIYVSFTVGKDKRTADFKIMKSIDSKWEKELITGLTGFTDTVALPQGKYHFVLGFAFGGNDDLLEISKTEPSPLFKRWRVEGPGVGTATELEEGVEIHNTYVSFNTFPNPIIIVDKKEVAYTPTKMGFKLAQSIYPRVSGSSKALKGNKAVELYGESARKGIIIIETAEEQ